MKTIKFITEHWPAMVATVLVSGAFICMAETLCNCAPVVIHSLKH